MNVFLSYASEDEALAKNIANEIERLRPNSCWFYSRDSRLADSYLKQIEHRLKMRDLYSEQHEAGRFEDLPKVRGI